MNQKEQIEAIAKEAGLSNAGVATVLEAQALVIRRALQAGDEVKLANVGRFHVLDRKARTGRNPSTGAVIEIAARKSVAFKASSTLKLT